MAKKIKFSSCNLGPMPRHLKDLTEAQREKVLTFYKGMKLEELRARQDLTSQQKVLAVKQGNETAFDDLDITEKLLDQAVMETYCKMDDPLDKAPHPGLVNLAKKIAQKVCEEINEKAPGVEADTPYKQQGTLEYVIQILQAAV